MAGGGQVINCDTLRVWNQQLENGIKSNRLVVMEFTATLAGGWTLTSPVLDDLAKKLTNVIFLKVYVDADEVGDVAEKQYGVKKIPTFVLRKGGNAQETIVGANKDDLLMAIAKHATTP